MAVPDRFSARLAETLARAYAQRTEHALAAYERSRDATDLDEALNHARAAVASLIEARGFAPCDVAGARELTSSLPAVGRLAEVCALHAERVMAASVAGLWRRLGLDVVPALWSAEDRRLAEGLLALALVSRPETAEQLMSAGLRRIAAGRLAGALVDALGRCTEATFASALGDARHSALARRYATGSDGLGTVARTEPVRVQLTRTLTAWFAEGAVRSRLPDALEAAFVHALAAAHRV
jgi:hypothetical protein